MRKFFNIIVLASFVSSGHTLAGDCYQISSASIQTHSLLDGGGGEWKVTDRTCLDVYDQGVVRSWHIDEKNKFDFYSSKIYCRDLKKYGGLGSDYRAITHFSYSQDGNDYKVNLPLGQNFVPVGVGLSVGKPAASPKKINNMRLIYDKVDNVAAGELCFAALTTSGGQIIEDDPCETTEWANPNRRIESETYRAPSLPDLTTRGSALRCNGGRVLVGVQVLAKEQRNRQAEIRDVKIQCARLRIDPEVRNCSGGAAP